MAYHSQTWQAGIQRCQKQARLMEVPCWSWRCSPLTTAQLQLVLTSMAVVHIETQLVPLLGEHEAAILPELRNQDLSAKQ